MRAPQIDDWLNDLERYPEDFGVRYRVLDHAKDLLLRRPEVSVPLMEGLCQAAEGSARLEDFSDLLSAILDGARIAEENGDRRGRSLTDALARAFEFWDGKGRVLFVHRLAIARAWARSGLAPPSSLASSEGPPRPSSVPGGRSTPDPAELERTLNRMLRAFIRKARGEVTALHGMLQETFPTLPMELRADLIRWCAQRRETLYADLCCLFLMDPDPGIRGVAGQALADRAAYQGLTRPLAARLAQLRNWMPPDPARDAVDQAIRLGIRAGLVPGDPPRPASPANGAAVLATLPDGGGAQSVMFTLRKGRSPVTVMLLLKAGYGIKDAFVLKGSASDQEHHAGRVVRDAGALEVPLTWLERNVANALEEGLNSGLPPIPGFVEVAELLGWRDLTPERVPIESWIGHLPGAERIRALSPQGRARLLKAGEAWEDRHPVIGSWFEVSDEARSALNACVSVRQQAPTLWGWLETRRGHWTELLGRSADVLASAGHPDADSFTATALALLEGQDLKKIPIMVAVHRDTLEAWAYAEAGPGVDREDTGPEASTRSPRARPAAPKSERKGELIRLLKASDISSEWIDGFLMAAVIAPELIPPRQWIPEILGNGIDPRSTPHIQRILEVLIFRNNRAVELAGGQAGLVSFLSALDSVGRQEWFRGFRDAWMTFKAAWSKKATTTQDRTMIEAFRKAAIDGLPPEEIVAAAEWITDRHQRNR
jgi:hypothetical protein